MQMKSRRSSAKKSEVKILGEEAEKLKQKLDQLKVQVKRKKQQKEMNKTSNSVYSTKTNTQPDVRNKMNATQSSFAEKAGLHEILMALKVQNIESKLKGRGVVTLEQLEGVCCEEMDSWREIPVGYRIKLKKYIQKQKERSSPKEEKKQNNYIDESSKVQEISNIESIIENRKRQNKFVVILRQKQLQSGQEEGEELREEEQEQMMLSVLQAFRYKHRSTSFKSKGKKREVKHVNWSPTVDQMQKQHGEVRPYPKEKISKSLLENSQLILKEEVKKKGGVNETQNSLVHPRTLGQGGELLNYKYCWVCLKRIVKDEIRQKGRDFCGDQCLLLYQDTFDQRLLSEVVETQGSRQRKKQQKMDQGQPFFELDFEMV